MPDQYREQYPDESNEDYLAYKSFGDNPEPPASPRSQHYLPTEHEQWANRPAVIIENPGAPVAEQVAEADVAPATFGQLQAEAPSSEAPVSEPVPAPDDPAYAAPNPAPFAEEMHED